MTSHKLYFDAWYITVKKHTFSGHACFCQNKKFKSMEETYITARMKRFSVVQFLVLQVCLPIIVIIITITIIIIANITVVSISSTFSKNFSHMYRFCLNFREKLQRLEIIAMLVILSWPALKMCLFVYYLFRHQMLYA